MTTKELAQKVWALPEIKERIEGKIAIVPMTGCWLWLGARRPDGYGKIKIEQKEYRVHRIAYMIYNHAVPTGIICHTCDNALCINPSHLIDSDHASNQRDACMRTHSGYGKSQYRGVAWAAYVQKWRGWAYKDKRRYELGYFTDEKNAAIAVDEKMKELYGEGFIAINVHRAFGGERGEVEGRLPEIEEAKK